jgi:hypothetical protein
MSKKNKSIIFPALFVFINLYITFEVLEQRSNNKKH